MRSTSTPGATILHLAAKFDRISLIEWILDREGVKAAKVQTYNGASCLHFACATGSFQAVKIILQAVPNYINLQMVNGVTPAYLSELWKQPTYQRLNKRPNKGFLCSCSREQDPPAQVPDQARRQHQPESGRRHERYPRGVPEREPGNGAASGK